MIVTPTLRRFRSSMLVCLFVALSIVAAGRARAEADEGEKVFNRYCSVCHSLEAGRNKFGPSLSGVVGRKSASIENFGYSESFRALGVTWTAETLDTYLTAPKKMAPGTLMMFPGLPNPDDRKNLIDFLMTVHD